MTGLEKWRKEKHEDIDSIYKDEAYIKIRDGDINQCRWCIYWDTSIDCSKSCKKDCKKGILAYLKNEVEEWN